MSVLRVHGRPSEGVIRRRPRGSHSRPPGRPSSGWHRPVASAGPPTVRGSTPRRPGRAVVQRSLVRRRSLVSRAGTVHGRSSAEERARGPSNHVTQTCAGAGSERDMRGQVASGSAGGVGDDPGETPLPRGLGRRRIYRRRLTSYRRRGSTAVESDCPRRRSSVREDRFRVTPPPSRYLTTGPPTKPFRIYT